MRRKSVIFIISVLILVTLSGCATKKKAEVKEPDIAQIRNICNMATLQCYYHNVAKSEKAAEKGISHWGEKDRKFWIEYTGIANLGIDMSKVQMKIEGTDIEVTLPTAELLNISIDEQTLNDNSYLSSANGLNKNEITADDQTAAINEAQQKMKETVQGNTALLLSAQNRAKVLIENYLKQLGEVSDIEYNIKWNYVDASDSPANDS